MKSRKLLAVLGAYSAVAVCVFGHSYARVHAEYVAERCFGQNPNFCSPRVDAAFVAAVSAATWPLYVSIQLHRAAIKSEKKPA